MATHASCTYNCGSTDCPARVRHTSNGEEKWFTEEHLATTKELFWAKLLGSRTYIGAEGYQIVAIRYKSIMYITKMVPAHLTLKYKAKMLWLDFCAVLRPTYWFMRFPYDKAWNTEVNELLCRGYKLKRVSNTSRYLFSLGDAEMWAGVPPREYTKLVRKVSQNLRPSRGTILKLNKMRMENDTRA